MPIPEQDALRAIAVAKANPNDPAVIAKAQALTRAYQAQQEAAGLSMFPEQERRRDEQASTLRSFFTEPNHGLDEDTLVSLNENFRESPDEKFKLFNRKWFEAAGVPRERVEREADELMKIYSEREWGTPSTTHKHFFDRIARDYQTREEVANAAKETSLQNLGVLRSELAFKERFRENSSYVGREQKWDKEFQSLKDRFDQKLAPHRSTVKLLSAALMTKEGVDVEDPTTMDEALAQRREIDNAASYRELAEMVMMVPAEDRKLVIAAAVAASANDEAGRKSVMEGLVEKFDRGLRGGMDSVVSIGERSQAIAVERAIAEGVEVPAEKAGTPEEYMEAVLQRVAGGDAYEVRAGVMKAVAGADFDKPSDEVKDQALAMIRENKDAIDLRDELRLAAENDIDPVTSEFLPVRGLYAAAESVPYMMTSMARGGWAINAMALAGDSYRSLRAANPTMTAEQAQTLSMLSGPFQAFIEKGQTTLALGQFKAVNRFFNQITRTKGAVASRFLTRTAATAGLEMVQENVQDLTPFVLQGLLSALDEDMPEVPWGPVYGDLLKQQPELFFAVLPLAVIGGGAGTYSDFKGGAELLTSYDLLRATGLSEAAASEVRALASQGNVEGAQTLLRQEFKTLGQDQKSVQEARAEAIPRMIAEREAMQQALNEAGELDILPAILREGEKYTLRYSGGEAVQYDSHAEAFARFEAVASSAVAALHEDMITAARMTTSQIERGREVKFIVSPLRPTTEDMEAQGVATGEDMAQRMEISEADKALTPKTEERKAKAMAGMVANSPEARTAVNYILGSATTSEAAPDSFGDRVVRNTVRLYQGATPFTLFEETAEGDAKFMIRELGLRRWMIGALRQWEATSGDTLFRASIKEESQIKDQDIVEAYSKMVQGYLAGRSKSGDQGRVFSSRFRKSIADALRGDFGAVLTGYASLFEAVYRRAAMIEKARRDKTFDGDLETFLAKSTGMSEQRLFERDVQREGSAIAQDLSGNPDFSSGEGTETTFSVIEPGQGFKQTAMPDGMVLQGPATFSVLAHHGTPHKVDRFRLDKIGTGEGAQAYGWGLYFAEAIKVAIGYRDSLSDPGNVPLHFDGRPLNTPWTSEIRERWSDYYKNLSESDADAMDELLSNLSQADDISSVSDALGFVSGRAKSLYTKIVKLKLEKPEIGPGNLYTVELLPDEGDFLDWDKPLSEQSEKVKAAIQKVIGPDEEMTEYMKRRGGTGGYLYGALATQWNAEIDKGKSASAELLRVGIPGIRYLDGNSRADGTGTYNYVIFDESLVRILEENGQPVEQQGGETTFSVRVSATGVKPPKGVKAKVSDALPIWSIPNTKGKSLGKKLTTKKNREKVFASIDNALTWLRGDPSRIATPSGWVNYLKKSGVYGDVMMPPTGIGQLFEDPKGYVEKLNGAYHGDLTIPGTQQSAQEGLNSTKTMRDLIGEGQAPHVWVTALHHLWGILSRMLPPIHQEGMWIRLISSKPVLAAIQSSIDGNFKMTVKQWKKVVQGARLETPGAGKIGNAATANANSFYLMLSRLNGRWEDLANVYAAPSAQEMGRRFWSLDAGSLGIKNKVQRFIGLTYGIPGVIMDRWKFVEFWLPTAIRGTGAESPMDYFAYSNGVPEDPLGIYGVYGGIDSGNEALSLAMYEGMELALQSAIDASPELTAALGSHANPGGLHWAGWNAIKNEAVGHSSLDFTADLIRNFGMDITADSVYSQARNGVYYTEGADTSKTNAKLILDHGSIKLERTSISGGLQQRRAGILGRGTGVGNGKSGEGTARGSQRRGGVDTTFSLLPDASNLDTEFARMFSPFQRSPELRAKLGLAMRQKTIGVETKLLPIIRSFYRTKNAIQREASVREGFEYDRLLRETFGADTPAKQDALPAVDRQAARSDARRIADQWMEGEMKKKEVAPRQTLIGFLRTLDAITRALPAEVRGKIGGSVALAKLVTPAAMLDEIESRVERIDVELERYLKKEADDRRKALFETAKPKREAGKKPKGKAGADIHDLFDRLKEALLWDGDQAEAWATMLEDRIGKGELSAEAEAHAKIEANLVRLFSDWKNADAARRTAAVDAGEEVWRVGYLAEKERIAQERERRAEVRAEIIAGTGKLGSRPERVVKAQQDAGLSGQWKEWFLSLFNFEQVAGFAMGAESKWTLWFSDAQREAEAKKLDEVQAVLDGLDELFRELGGSRLGGEKLQWKLSQPSFETKAGGKMSELQGITALLMWRQEDGKRHMQGKRDENGKIVSAWSYDETFIAEIEKNLSTEALAVMDYLTDQYAGEYETLNPIFRELNGINLPRNDKYSPLTVKPQQAPGGQTTDPVTGSTMSNGSMTPGSLRTRAQVVAEPDFRNAVEVFVGHKKQLAHWKAYAVFSRDAQAILGNREVGNAIEAASGQEAAKVLRSWLDLFAQGGVRDAGSHLALTKALGAAMGRASAVQLVGRLGTLAIQTTQLGAAAAKMPVRDYIVRLSKLLTGNLGWGEALNSPYIQRRLAQMPASVQVAMEGLRAGKPNMIKHAAQRVGRLLSGTDALFTAGTYAMVFDYQLTKATKAGVDPVTAAEIARNEAERIVDEIAQPTRQGTRSLFEATATNPLGRVAWAFASEARKNMALVAYTGGKRPSGDLARALLYVIVFNGVLSALIRTAWRDLRDDEEGEDEWGMRRILLSVASEPLYGFPGFGEIAQDAIFAAAGEWKPSGSILDAPVKAPAAIVRAPENFGMVLEGDFEQPLRDLETMLMAGGLFNDTIAGLASFSHVLRDAESLIRNFIPDTP